MAFSPEMGQRCTWRLMKDSLLGERSLVSMVNCRRNPERRELWKHLRKTTSCTTTRIRITCMEQVVGNVFICYMEISPQHHLDK